MTHRILLLLGAALLPGCALPPTASLPTETESLPVSTEVNTAPVPPAPPPASEPTATPPRTKVVIVHETPPPDPAGQAFRDIAGYADFNDNMLRDELARLETLADGSSYHDLRIAALLWMLDRPEHASWLQLLNARLAEDDDARVAALAAVIGRATARQRSRAERITSLESQLAEAQRRVDQLSAKIDALKSLEKELLSRPDPR